LEKTSSLFMANSYYFYDSLLLAEVALAVDEPLDALTYLALASTLTGVLPGHFLNASNPTFWDQGSQAAQMGWFLQHASAVPAAWQQPQMGACMWLTPALTPSAASVQLGW
jgi:hypothetical protein